MTLRKVLEYKTATGSQGRQFLIARCDDGSTWASPLDASRGSDAVEWTQTRDPIPGTAAGCTNSPATPRIEGGSVPNQPSGSDPS